MPTLITHPAIALLSTWFRRVHPRVVALGALATMLPDIDVLGFAYGIPYGATFGHRGFTHSIVFALASAACLTLLTRSRNAFAFLFLCALSHPLLDAMTDGGLGIAFFSPFSNHRYFFPWRPIRVSPIGAGFFSARGLETLASELVWVWLPCAALALLGKYFGQRKREAGQER
jgi:inner membrane protein